MPPYLRNCGIHAANACHGAQESSGCACGKQEGRDSPCTDEQQAKKRGARSNADFVWINSFALDL